MTKRLALVTGGTRGIGAAISIALQQAGYLVTANYASNHDAANAFTAETGIKAYSWDVASMYDCDKGIAQIEADAGQPIEILVNNAGITRDTAFHKMHEEQWNAVMDANLRSCFNMCRVIFPGMRERGFGRIINISSINGQMGQFGQVNYAAAKAGMLGFTKALALEGARKNVTVNAICPGYIATDMVAAIDPKVLAGIVEKIPVGRLGDVDEIARAVIYLSDEKAGFVTGSTLSVNGGQYRI